MTGWEVAKEFREHTRQTDENDDTATTETETETVVAWEDGDGEQHRETLAPGESREFDGDLVAFVGVEVRGRGGSE